jgi:hypothetical protein
MASTPDEFLCPITLLVMNDPVIGSDGRTYERAAIMQWLRTNPHSPLTREPMTLSSLKPNYALKSAIERYQKESRTGAPKTKPVPKATPVPKAVKKPLPSEPVPQLIPMPVARPMPSAPPPDDVYVAIQIYQEDMARQMAARSAANAQPSQPSQPGAFRPIPNQEAERRKKSLLCGLILCVVIVLIIMFAKLFSSD